MFLLGIGIVSCLIGAALAVMGLFLWSILDISWGETLGNIGLAMMVIPFCVGLLIGALALLLSLFGLVILF